MTDDIVDLDKTDEVFMTSNDFFDEILEASARGDGGRVITVGYCATAASAWYRMPF